MSTHWLSDEIEPEDMTDGFKLALEARATNELQEVIGSDAKVDISWFFDREMHFHVMRADIDAEAAR